MTEVTGCRRGPRRTGLVAAALATALATAACTGTEVPAPTIRVDRGPVGTTVSASGKLVAITEQNLGFPDGGQLAEVAVKVGDRVEPGQVLARLDDFALGQALEQSTAQLARQRALLAKITGGNSVEAAQATLDQAEKILDATEKQVDATNHANDSATDRAETQLDFDRSVLERAERQLRADQAACRTAPAPTTPRSRQSAAASPSSEPSEPASGGLFRGTEDTSTTGTTRGTGMTTSGLTTSPACDQIAADQTAVQQAKGAVVSSETALDAAEQREKVDSASGNLSIENARQTVVTAENNLGTAESDTPADGDAQAALVRDAEASVALAQRDLDDSTLRAPVAGVVSAVNGAVGEFVAAASGATALAPGSNARLPGITDAGAAGAGGAVAPGGGAFIVLNDVESFQLVVPFEESDAARIAPNQQVDVSIDAIPDLTRPATVLAVAPTGEEASGIVNYNATIVLTESDPRLRDGQTAETTVTVDSVDNVLRVPSAAVNTQNGASTVNSPGSDGPVVTPFEPGRVGDEYTEVRSGLAEGQEILLPQAEVTASDRPGGPPGGPPN
jgi:HlyD family secretion protein